MRRGRPSRDGRAVRPRHRLRPKPSSPTCAMSSIDCPTSYTPAETRLWLHAKHPLLNNERAIDAILADRTEEVLPVIQPLPPHPYLSYTTSERHVRTHD